jgi:hypothetical protein
MFVQPIPPQAHHIDGKHNKDVFYGCHFLIPKCPDLLWIDQPHSIELQWALVQMWKEALEDEEHSNFFDL